MLYSSAIARFAEMVERKPHRAAVVDGDRSVSYLELDSLATRMAARLSVLDPDPGLPVALVMPQNIESIAAMLGVLRTGLFYCALEESMPPARLKHILSDLEPSVVLAYGRSAVQLARRLAPQATIIDVETPSTEDAAPLGTPSISGTSLAAIYYTTGTTGNPKGVTRDHATVLRRVKITDSFYQVSTEDHVALLYGLSYSSSMNDLFVALLNGATLHLFDYRHEGIHALVEWLNKHQISYLHIHAAVLRQVLDSLPQGFLFAFLRFLRPSNQLYSDDINRVRRHLQPGTLICHSLASTESGPLTMNVLDSLPLPAGQLVPKGHPLPHVEIRLLDEEGKEVFGEGSGEMVVRSRFFTSEYWRNPELTRQRYRIDVDNPDYHTIHMGDLARRLPDGKLLFLGRKDTRVKLRGYSIHLIDIEIALEQLEPVQRAVVMERTLAEGSEPILIAYVEPKAGAFNAGYEPELRTLMRKGLPEYMIPTRFVFLDRLPVGSNGKVLKQALPHPTRNRPDTGTPFAPPTTPFEGILADIWSEALQIDEIGIDDEFMMLGGSSLQAGRIVMGVVDAFGVAIPLHTLYDAPNIRRMADIVMTHILLQEDEADMLAYLSHLPS